MAPLLPDELDQADEFIRLSMQPTASDFEATTAVHYANESGAFPWLPPSTLAYLNPPHRHIYPGIE